MVVVCHRGVYLLHNKPKSNIFLFYFKQKILIIYQMGKKCILSNVNIYNPPLNQCLFLHFICRSWLTTRIGIDQLFFYDFCFLFLECSFVNKFYCSRLFISFWPVAYNFSSFPMQYASVVMECSSGEHCINSLPNTKNINLDCTLTVGEDL